MKVLMITGDSRFGPGNDRYELQKAAVGQLDVVAWPRGDSLFKIISKARRERYDVITAQDPFFRGHLAHHLVQLWGGKLNIQVHTDLMAYPWWRRVFAQLQLRNANTVRVVSERIKRQVLAMAPRANVTVLPIYVDTLRFSSVVRMPHSTKNILWIGRFEEEKDPIEAVRVLKEVLKVVPSARLIMLGAGSEQEELAKEAANLPVNQVVTPGWVNPMHYLDTADVVLCTSKHESYGASIVEALAAGVPVIAPDVGVAEEAGATVVARDELASAVVAVLIEPRPGRLKITGYSRDEWAQAWVRSLQ